MWHFRDVYYDKGYDFDFIKFINYFLKRELNCFFATTGYTGFAAFYKRDKYRYERETRFSIDVNNPNVLNGTGLEVNESGQRKFICLPIIRNKSKNPFFDLKLVEVIHGDNVTEIEKMDIFKLLKENFDYNVPLRSKVGSEYKS